MCTRFDWLIYFACRSRKGRRNKSITLPILKSNKEKERNAKRPGVCFLINVFFLLAYLPCSSVEEKKKTTTTKKKETLVPLGPKFSPPPVSLQIGRAHV